MDFRKIEERLKQVPEPIKKAFFSQETALKIADVGNKFDLHLDQIDELTKEVGLTMIGINSSKHFSDRISKNLQIDKNVAKKIVADLNTSVLNDIITQFRINNKDNQKENGSNSDEDRGGNIRELERAGDFIIENESETETIQNENIDRSAIIRKIENPDVANAVEPLSDHLLKSSFEEEDEKRTEADKASIQSKPPEPEAPANLPISQPEDVKPVQKTPVEPPQTAAPAPKPEPPKSKSSDMYREPID